MRTISISTDVFAAIWARRQPGEDTEDAILRGVLGLSGSSQEPPPSATGGFRDDRNGVTFPEGFEIFRVYKGREYRARATANAWLLLSDMRSYPSLHKLSSAVVSGNENSWQNWKCHLPDGREAFIDALRS